MFAGVIIFVLAGILGATPLDIGPADFKSGTVRIVLDQAFGADTEWDALFDRRTDAWTALLPDGSFFRTAAADGLVHKFGPEGNLVKTFGRKGQGPGDLLNPGAIAVLDGKTLVVNDAGNLRLSLFDIDGTFLRTVKMAEAAVGVPQPVLSLAALDGGKIALVVQEGRASPPNVIAVRYRVLLKSLENDDPPKELAVFDWEKPRSKFMIRVMDWEPTVFVAKAGPDKVMVACSGTPEVVFFSGSGEKRSSFSLNAERTKITWKHLEFAMRADENPQGFGFVARNKADIELPEYLPSYSRLALDADGRLIVYDFNAARFSRDVTFKVLTTEGRELAAVKIAPGDYEAVMPVHFWKEFAYAYLTKKGNEDSFIFARFKLAAD